MAKYLNIDTTNYNQYFSQKLDNVEYILHVYYNSRNQGWYLSIYDSDLFDDELDDNSAAGLYTGRKLMPNQDVLKRAKNDSLPQGALFCVDQTFKDISEQESITIGTFGDDLRYRLVYFTEEEKSTYGL